MTSRGVDHRALGTYLEDHLAGATAGAQRMSAAADLLRSTPVHPLIARTAAEVRAEREELAALAVTLGFRPSLLKRVLASSAELLARLLPPVRHRSAPSAATLLEMELLRSALVGKMGLFEVLVDLSDELSLDRDHWRGRLERVRRQVDDLDQVHAWVRSRVLRAP